MPGLYVKLGGAIFIGLVYGYYYRSGDTFNYYYHAQIINSSFSESLSTWFDLIRRTPVDKNPYLYSYVSQMFWYQEPSTYSVAVICAILGLLTGTTYLPTALLFAFISYSGIWAMYKTFASIYPKLSKELAICFLFIPSSFVWGSGIFKDTICMFGLGWMTYCTFRIFINKDYSIKNFALLGISFYLISVIKIYILLAFLPALSLWLMMSYSDRIRSAGVRWIINIVFVAITAGGFFFFTNRFADQLNRYSLDRIAQTAAVTRGWIGYVSDVQEGSGYDLGDFQPTLSGMLSKFPQAVVVTLFRPFPWEVKKVIVALSAVEALVFLFFTLKVLFRRNKSFQAFKDPNVIFFIMFTLIFAFAVGISSYNFGALSRYKIPCLPFYAAALAILLYKDQEPQKGVSRKVSN
jgi:hypothetical protein